MEEKVSEHKWNFFKAGGFYQVDISDASDIENIGSLDQKLWAALSCPTDGLVFDSKTLDLIDSDNDLSIRHNEVVAAVEWVCRFLKDKSKLLESSPSLELSNIDDSSPEGAALLASAKQILADLGKPDAGEITVEDFSDPLKIFAGTAFNADGIITKISCGGDKELENVLSDIILVEGGKPDRSGEIGVDESAIKKFYSDAMEYGAWLDAPNADSAILPLGSDTCAANSALEKVADKIDDFFVRAEIMAFDSTADSLVNPSASSLSDALSVGLSFQSPVLRELPISRICPDCSLNLLSGINPAWKDAAEAFAKLVASPALGSDFNGELTSSQWRKIKSMFVPYSSWSASKPSGAITSISAERVRAILSENRLDDLLKLVERDKSLQPKIDNINNVEKLVLFNANIFKLLKNFVSFSDFYKEKVPAIFQFGSLYIDQRTCDLCIKVENTAAHAQMAALCYGYLLYCVCKRRGEDDINIVAVVTAGDSDNLIVGKHGIFYDTRGRDWDAMVVKIVANSIEVHQAFFSPYKRLVKWVSEQIAKRASAEDNENMKKLAAVPLAAGSPPQAAESDKKKKLDVGTVAALGVAVGGVTTAFGMFLEFVFGMGIWLPLGVVGIVLSISLPSVLIAAIKLRARNLAPILDANGWAVNGKAKVGIAFGHGLTKLARLPRGSKINTIVSKK